jgi:hypothetical protein
MRYYNEGHCALLEKLYQQILVVYSETIETLKNWLDKYSDIYVFTVLLG